MPFERENLAASTYGGSHLYYINKVIEAPGETMNDLDILEGVANAYGGQEIKNYVKAGKSMEQLTKDGFQRVKSLAGMMEYREPEMTFDEFKDIGVISWQPQPGDNLVDTDFKNFCTYIETNGVSGRALDTTTGKFEAYSLAMTEDYEARRFYNFDDDPSRYGVNPSDLELVNIGQTFVSGYPVEGIYSKSANYDNNRQDNPLIYTVQDASLGNKYVFQPNATSAALTQNMKSARFVYPIPMYIPLFEGRHACDNSGDYMLNGVDMRHPDPLNLSVNYTLCMGNYHSIFRSHSTGNINPYTNETYKRGNDGDFTFPDGETDAEDIRKNTGVYAWHLGVYEPLFISYEDAAANGNIKTGDTLMVSSPRASGLFTAEVTKTMRPGVAVSGEGSWTCFRNCDIELEDGTVLNNEKVDLGGSANTLSTQRPSRICQGSSYGTYQRIKIRKIKSIQLAN
jgi:anaerobic dimethyl sulfoxide reductase subunit A